VSTAEVVMAVIAGITLTLTGVTFIGRWVIRSIRETVQNESLVADFHDHQQKDVVAFAAIDQQFVTGALTMKEINDRGIRTETKVDMLVQWQTGINPETKPTVE
jgi:hypothetical protein